MPVVKTVESDLTRAFRGVCNLLKAHPRLNKVKTWRTWDGSAGDALDPTADQAPWLRLTLMKGAVERLATGPQGVVLRRRPMLRVELFTQGSDLGQFIDLAGAVQDAFWGEGEPGDTLVRCRAKEYGVSDIRLVDELAPASPEDLGKEGIYGTGAYELTVNQRGW